MAYIHIYVGHFYLKQGVFGKRYILREVMLYLYAKGVRPSVTETRFPNT